MSAAQLDVVVTLVGLEAWITATDRAAPDLAARAPLHAAVVRARRHYAGLDAKQGEQALARFERWAKSYDAVTQPLAHRLSPHAVLAADLLAAMDGHVSALRDAQAARRAKGKAVDARKLADLEAVNTALVQYDAALQVAMGHTRATQEATFIADRLHRASAHEGDGAWRI